MKLEDATVQDLVGALADKSMALVVALVAEDDGKPRTFVGATHGYYTELVALGALCLTDTQEHVRKRSTMHERHGLIAPKGPPGG